MLVHFPDVAVYFMTIYLFSIFKLFNDQVIKLRLFLVPLII